jgi:hypothetical protein
MTVEPIGPNSSTTLTAWNNGPLVGILLNTHFLGAQHQAAGVKLCQRLRAKDTDKAHEVGPR